MAFLLGFFKSRFSKAYQEAISQTRIYRPKQTGFMEINSWFSSGVPQGKRTTPLDQNQGAASLRRRYCITHGVEFAIIPATPGHLDE
jgi:hypothetical protein